MEYFRRALRADPGKAALVGGLGRHRHRLSYAELARCVDAMVGELKGLGLEPGDRVLLAVPPSVETYIALLAILEAGLVAMYIDPAHGAAVAGHCLQGYPPAAIVGTRRVLWLRWLLPELRRIPRRLAVSQATRRARDGVAPARPPVPRSPDDAALLTFTSGSTGLPKPVVRSHGFLARQLDSLNSVAQPQAHDVDFTAMPMFVLFDLANAITSVLPAMQDLRRADPRTLCAQLLAERASRIVASPALLERLAEHCLRVGVSLPELRQIATGGAPVDPSLAARLQAIAPHARLRIVYGSTEAEPIASVDADGVSAADVARMRAGGGLLVGYPVVGCRVAVIDSAPGVPIPALGAHAFASHCLAQGSIGEVVVSGAHVLRGYADPKFNAETKIEVDGTCWHRTGDAGYFDARGRLWLVGRLAAGIHDAKGSVFPFQVEYAVDPTLGIKRAAMIADRGQRVLVVEPDGRDFAASRLETAPWVADYGIDRIVTIPQLPLDRRHHAKIDYSALRRLLNGERSSSRSRRKDTVATTQSTKAESRVSTAPAFSCDRPGR